MRITFSQLLYVVLHLVLAGVTMVMGTLALFGRYLPPTAAGGALLCAASATLIFHAAIAATGKKD